MTKNLKLKSVATIFTVTIILAATVTGIAIAQDSCAQEISEAVMKERVKYDPDGDGKIGVEVAVNALQVVAGIRKSEPNLESFTNSLGMTFNLIPAGTFIMGSPAYEPGRWDSEPQHKVTLTQSYYIQTTGVTQGQWKAVMGSNSSNFSNCGDDCPVEEVSWNDVQEFITELNKKGEGTYRLPTESEWEYAARAGSNKAFANGDITETECGFDPNLDVMGWYCGNSGVTYGGCFDAEHLGGPSCAGTHPVAQKQANTWGLYDMHGNIYEFCQDWYGGYPTGPVTDPTGSDTGLTRVIRGGSWYYVAGDCRSANRVRHWPDSRTYTVGFRLAFYSIK